ncbi:hypothetical protein JCM5296_006834 [Sporobolomyces johnsonii]
MASDAPATFPPHPAGLQTPQEHPQAALPSPEQEHPFESRAPRSDSPPHQQQPLAPTSDLSSLPPSSSADDLDPPNLKTRARTRSSVSGSTPDLLQQQQQPPPLSTAPQPDKPQKAPRRKSVKMDDIRFPSPPQGPPTPAATNSPSGSTSFPLPSFLAEDPLSSDPDSSSDDDALGNPKPPRPPTYSKSTGLPRPRPSYYYDAEYDPGTAGKKKRGRRGGFKGVPVFEPTMDDFEKNGGFYGYVKRIEKYGLRSGIVKVIPPKEWSESLPSVLPPLRNIRLREPIEQHMMGSQGLYRVTNVAKTRIWNAAQWKDTAVMDKWDAPDVLKEREKGDRSERSTKSTTASSAAGTKEARKKREREKEEKRKEEDADADGESDDDDDGDEQTPKKGRRTPARKVKAESKSTKGKGKETDVEMADASKPASTSASAAASPAPAAKKKRQSNLQRAEPTEEEWAAFCAKFDELPHGMKKEDYSVEMMRDFERRYWRTLTFGEPPMYGADMAGSLFTDSTTAWNVAHLGDLLPKLAPKNCSIPGVVSPYLYFGMWRATFAWHVEDADLYSINYIHFGAPKFWYSVPQEQSERFERVMEGFFPTDRSKCSQFLRHKAFLASPRVLSNSGITLNRCAQLPGEFILTYPKGYHSGFNLGYNCAESINFATERWLPLGKVAKSCYCVDDSVSIDVNIWLKQAAKAEAQARGEPWPYDDLPSEDDLAPSISTPTVQQHKRMASVANPSTVDHPRKKPKSTSSAPGVPSMSFLDVLGSNLNPQAKADLARLFQQQQAAAAASASSSSAYSQQGVYQQYPPPQQQQYRPHPQQQQKIAQAPPQPPKEEFVCALCPDMSEEGLVRIGEPGVKSKKRLEAHRVCVMFTPATWIEEDPTTGEEIVRGYARIEKARWKLKCSLCTEPHGTKVQCTKGKCTKAFHVTCALQDDSGIFMDATIPADDHSGGEISVLAQAKAELAEAAENPSAPPSPSKVTVPQASTSSSAAPAAADAGLRLTILCRTHNPEWQKQEQTRKAAELKAKVDALADGARIRVRTNNGIYDVNLTEVLADKESIAFAFDDGKRGTVKWKHVVFPDSPEAQRKKEAAAERARAEKMAALDRPAYRNNSKRAATSASPAPPSVAPTYGYAPAPAHPAPHHQPAPGQQLYWPSPHNPYGTHAWPPPPSGHAHAYAHPTQMPSNGQHFHPYTYHPHAPQPQPQPGQPQPQHPHQHQHPAYPYPHQYYPPPPGNAFPTHQYPPQPQYPTPPQPHRAPAPAPAPALQQQHHQPAPPRHPYAAPPPFSSYAHGHATSMPAVDPHRAQQFAHPTHPASRPGSSSSGSGSGSGAPGGGGGGAQFGHPAAVASRMVGQASSRSPTFANMLNGTQGGQQGA